MQVSPTFHDRGRCFTFRFRSEVPGFCVKGGEKAWDEDCKSQSAVLLGGRGVLDAEVWEVEIGRSRRAVREAATIPGCGGTASRREARRPRRVCTGRLNEADHDCAFGGVSRRTALPEVSLSHSLVEPLPGEVGLSVSGGGGVEVSDPGWKKLLMLGPESEEVGRPRPLLGRLPATLRVVPSVRRKSFSLLLYQNLSV